MLWETIDDEDEDQQTTQDISDQSMLQSFSEDEENKILHIQNFHLLAHPL